jgi:hypothetical protein
MKEKDNSLQAFDLIRQAAYEYNKAEYKFYTQGFFKYVRDGSTTFLIEDIYINPDFRGTPVAQIILSEFETFMKMEGIISYYGRVFKRSLSYQKRLDTFVNWGMTKGLDNTDYTIVSKLVGGDGIISSHLVNKA